MQGERRRRSRREEWKRRRGARGRRSRADRERTKDGQDTWEVTNQIIRKNRTWRQLLAADYSRVGKCSLSHPHVAPYMVNGIY